MQDLGSQCNVGSLDSLRQIENAWSPGRPNREIPVCYSCYFFWALSSIERKRGPLRVAHLPGESQPVIYSVHGAIAEHYRVDPATLKESHATIDHVISATAG